MTSSSPIFPQVIFNAAEKIVNADASNLKTLVIGDADGTRIDSIIITSTETASARDLQFIITRSAVDYIIGTISIPLNSGFTNSINSVQFLTSTNFPVLNVDANGNRFLMLDSGSTLKVKSLTTVTAAKEICIFVSGGHF
jgi:hypothetical protein